MSSYFSISPSPLFSRHSSYGLRSVLRGRGRISCLGWIRIEPDTEIYRLAIEEGILNEDTDLLPTDEKELERLFFCRSSFRFFNFIIISVFRFLEEYLKPFVKLIIENTLKIGR